MEYIMPLRCKKQVLRLILISTFPDEVARPGRAGIAPLMGYATLAGAVEKHDIYLLVTASV
jgi:hypothetical protein